MVGNWGLPGGYANIPVFFGEGSMEMSSIQHLYPNIEPIYQKSLKLPAMLVYNQSREMLAMLLAQGRENWRMKAWMQ
jgi:hypothetical protein